MPVRRIPLGRRSLTGRHNWDDRARGVGFESSLERDFVTLTLLDPAVRNIEGQPVEIRYPVDGRQRRYTPDFLVSFEQAAPLLVEVKFSDDLEAHREELQPKLDAAAAHANARGWRFEVWTEHEIRGTRLENAKFLLPCRRTEPDPGLCARLLQGIAGHEDARPKIVELVDECWPDLEERARGLSALWHLVAVGRLAIDMNRTVDMESQVWAPRGSHG